MAREKVLPLSHKLYFDAAYTAVARAVRYTTMPCAELRKKLCAAEKEFGTPTMDQVARELLDYDHDGKVLVARLKPQVRKFCFGLLGPPPEDAADFYRNTDGSWPTNTPAEVREQAEQKPERRAKAKAPQTALPTVLPPEREPTPQKQRLRELRLPQLADELHAARRSLLQNCPRSFLGKEAKKEIALLEAEYRRRGCVIPETLPEPTKRRRGA
jgi:hypothetical protein